MEIHEAEAKRYLELPIERFAPDFIMIECANAIRKKVLLKQLSIAEGDVSFQLLWKLPRQKAFVLESSLHLLPCSFEILKILHYHPITDCIYLTAAEAKNALFITADKILYNRVMKPVFPFNRMGRKSACDY